MQKCKDAGMKLLDLIWVDRQVCGPRSQKHSSDIVWQGQQDEEAFVLCEAAKVRGSIMMSVGWSSQGLPLKLRHHDISRKHFQRTAQRHIYGFFLRKIDRNMVRTKLTD